VHVQRRVRAEVHPDPVRDLTGEADPDRGACRREAGAVPLEREVERRETAGRRVATQRIGALDDRAVPGTVHNARGRWAHVLLNGLTPLWAIALERRSRRERWELLARDAQRLAGGQAAVARA
jgi:hypothetical protein